MVGQGLLTDDGIVVETESGIGIDSLVSVSAIGIKHGGDPVDSHHRPARRHKNYLPIRNADACQGRRHNTIAVSPGMVIEIVSAENMARCVGCKGNTDTGVH